MSDKLALAATFSLPVEAQLVRGLLEAEGIRAVVTGEEAVSVFGGAQGQITLHVAESDAPRAVGILAAAVAEQESDDGPRDEDESWLCPLCDDAVNDDLSVCPVCETPRPPDWKSEAIVPAGRRDSASQDIQVEPPPAPVQITADTPIEAVPSAIEDDLDIPDPETFLGDDLVRRAFLTALFGAIIPLLTFYSFWLLGRVVLYPGKISPRLMPRLYAAMALNLLVFCFYFLVLFGRVLYR